MKAPIEIALVSLGVIAVIGSGWFLKQETRCMRLIDNAKFIGGDVQVRQNSARECSLCRDDGPLYDIVYDYCDSDDAVRWRSAA